MIFSKLPVELRLISESKSRLCSTLLADSRRNTSLSTDFDVTCMPSTLPVFNKRSPQLTAIPATRKLLILFTRTAPSAYSNTELFCMPYPERSYHTRLNAITSLEIHYDIHYLLYSRSISPPSFTLAPRSETTHETTWDLIASMNGLPYLPCTSTPSLAPSHA